MSKIRFTLAICLSFALAAILATNAQAQIVYCQDCNNLTHQCEDPMFGDPDEICISGEDPENGEWCYSHGGGPEPCDPAFALSADGYFPRSAALPALDLDDQLIRSRVAVAPWVAKDCRNRIRAWAYSAEEGARLREVSARITI